MPTILRLSSSTMIQQAMNRSPTGSTICATLPLGGASSRGCYVLNIVIYFPLPAQNSAKTNNTPKSPAFNQ